MIFTLTQAGQLAANNANGAGPKIDLTAFRVTDATGYTPNLDYLAELGALTDTGHPRHRKGLSTTHPGLGYVGLEWQRSLSSASLRGVGRDAHYVVRRLTPADAARLHPTE